MEGIGRGRGDKSRAGLTTNSFFFRVFGSILCYNKFETSNSRAVEVHITAQPHRHICTPHCASAAKDARGAGLCSACPGQAV